MTPVAEHGTSARMASKGNDIIAGGKSLASALTIFMGRPSRALFSATRRQSGLADIAGYQFTNVRLIFKQVTGLSRQALSRRQEYALPLAG